MNQAFASDVARLAAEGARTPLVIVYFEKRRHDYIPTPDELRAHVRLTSVTTIRHEGAVYRVDGSGPPSG